MHLVRTGRVARTVAMFFLLWTGVDLLSPSLCAIEQERDGRSAQAESAAVFSAADSSHSSTQAAAEDCFCCCQHLVSTAAWASVHEHTFAQRVAPLSAARVRVVHTRLDHPPRFV